LDRILGMKRSIVRNRILPTLGLLACLFQASAQDRILVYGRVVSASTGMAINDVHVRQPGTELGAISNGQGDFSLAIDGNKPAQVVATAVGYAPLYHTFTTAQLEKGEWAQLRLESQAVELAPVIILPSAPEVVYQRQDLHVGDYFSNKEGLWVLTYEHPRMWHKEAEAGRQVYRQARLHLLDTNFVECCSVRIPTEVVGLRHDHAQRTIVEGVGSGWFAFLEGQELRLQEVDLATLHEKVLPWTDSIQGHVLGNNFDPTFPAFDHFAVDPLLGLTRTICSVQDAFRMELFRSEYKYMSGHDKVVAMDLALGTGVDAEIIAGYMTGFHNNIYFEPTYAPLFVVNDTLCVFDHYTHAIRRFLPDGSSVDQVPISYHQQRHWSTKLLQDPSDDAVYALFVRDRRTWLRTVDPCDGSLGPVRMLDHPYPEEVQVDQGYAYFIYRPYGSLQHRTLYRQAVR